MSTNTPAEALSTHLLLALAVPAFQQLDDDLFHLLRGIARRKVFLQSIIADRNLALQRFFFAHDEVDDIILELTFGAELFEPLGLSQRWGYLIARSMTSKR